MDLSRVFTSPRPAGIDLSENRTPRQNAVVIAICAVAAGSVALRFLMRIYYQRSRPEVDDWLIGASLIPLIALLAAAVVCGEHGLGKHIWSASLGDLILLRKALFAYLLIYLAELLLIKVSILMFYRRIFGMNWSIWACLFISYGWTFGSMIATISVSNPVSYFWTQGTSTSTGEYRFNFYNYLIGNAATNVVIDFLILLVPLPIVWSLKMPTMQKVGICSVLLLGVVACITSIVRIHTLTYLKTSIDLSWVMSDVYVWSIVEPCIGIVCACLPALQPFIRLIAQKLSSLGVRRSRGVNKVRKSPAKHSHSNVSSTHSLSSTRSPLPFTHYDDERAQLTTFTTRVEMVNPKERDRLEKGLDPMAIRVQQVVHWSVN
ncbi:uncharacterized protein N7511_005319 [Penicillium nucicola]|uniref:uncharacterized protein n=1 Tax=Penicillium nucicola TaxID=1850975 RepID=UPI002545B3D8|nr:uncharacterized protein N7511_005319 [Penicillium nucicola]KAJ5761937.1 hypothetical protein N7511_005319 [Penicillium nucicola]